MNTKRKIIGKRIQTARKVRNLTVERFAEQLGIASESLAHIECGSSGPSLKLLMSIADALDVSLDYLTGRSGIMEINGQYRELNEKSGIDSLTEPQKLALDGLIQTVLPFLKQNF